MVGFHLDTVSSHEIVDGILPPLSDQQAQELEGIIRNIIKKMH